MIPAERRAVLGPGMTPAYEAEAGVKVLPQSHRGVAENLPLLLPSLTSKFNKQNEKD